MNGEKLHRDIEEILQTNMYHSFRKDIYESTGCNYLEKE